MTNNDFALSLQSSAFDEYIAGRFLFLNGYYNQALILASTAVEKYLKTVLAVLNIKKRVHLDKYTELCGLFSSTPYHMLPGMLDEYFLDMLGKIYKYRYLDVLEGRITIGFLTNQFLGELDYTIEKIDRLIQITRDDGIRIDSAYRHALKQKLPILFQNNFLLDRVEKNEFMNRISEGYALHLDPAVAGCMVVINGNNLQPVYEGNMNLIKVNSP
jgi:HEPN domain-containing protein